MGGPGSGPRPKGGTPKPIPPLPAVVPQPRPGSRFEPCRFTAYLLDGTMRFDRNGGLMVTFVSPEDQADPALGLRQFLRVAVPLSITVETLEGWEARRDAQGEHRQRVS